VTVVTVSRELGSRGDQIAQLVAERLGLSIVDRERLHWAALATGASEAALHELEMWEEERWVDRILQWLRSVPATPPEESDSAGFVLPMTDPLAGIFSPVLPPASIAIAELVKVLNRVIEQRADEDNVLFLGQGAEVLLRRHPKALHVRITADLAYRVATLLEQTGLSKSAVQRRLRASDQERAEYVRRYHNTHWDDARNYHLVINTGLVPLDMAVELIVAASAALAG
jgi:cytidylate kinase